MLRSDALKPGPMRLADSVKLTPVVVFALSLTLAGCSTELLRFDAPAFSLNGDGERTAEVADVSDTRTGQDPIASSPPAASYAGARDGMVSEPRTATVAPSREAYRAPKRTAAVAPQLIPAPIAVAPPPATAALTTGALQGGTDARAGDGAGSITVEAGDTLYQISRRHGVSVDAIRSANGLSGNVIRPGQTLVLPGAAESRTTSVVRPVARPVVRPEIERAPRGAATLPAQNAAGGTYTVRSGDSLYAISRQTGVSVAELKRRNGISDVRAIRAGQSLALGGRGIGQSAPVPPTARVAARTDERSLPPITAPSKATPLIKAKPIRTVPITRESAPAEPLKAPPETARPRIINQRPEIPIAAKPRTELAALPQASAPAKFRWPARGRVIAGFNHSGQGVKNDGINIALPLGTEIAAVGDGVVAYSGSELAGYGNLVLVRHDNGWVSAYAHASEILVKRGDRIARGQTIAKAGHTGDVTQPQLHFELRKGAKPVDPMPHLDAL